MIANAGFQQFALSIDRFHRVCQTYNNVHLAEGRLFLFQWIEKSAIM
jgi:hypothetical protein